MTLSQHVKTGFVVGLLSVLSLSSQAQLTDIHRAYCSGSITKDNVRTLGITISGMSALYAGKPIYSGTIRINGWYGENGWMLSNSVAWMRNEFNQLKTVPRKDPATGEITEKEVLCHVSNLRTFPTTLTDMSDYSTTGTVLRRTVVAYITLYKPVKPLEDPNVYVSITFNDDEVVPVTPLCAGYITIL